MRKNDVLMSKFLKLSQNTYLFHLALLKVFSYLCFILFLLGVSSPSQIFEEIFVEISQKCLKSSDLSNLKLPLKNVEKYLKKTCGGGYSMARFFNICFSSDILEKNFYQLDKYTPNELISEILEWKFVLNFIFCVQWSLRKRIFL